MWGNLNVFGCIFLAVNELMFDFGEYSNLATFAIRQTGKPGNDFCHVVASVANESK